MNSPRGFSLLEAMVAVVLLGIGLVGALSGMVAAQKQIRDGSTRQFREQLLDASAQRWMLGSKSTLAASATAISTCTSACNLMAVATSPWSPDPTQSTGFVTGDLSTGAYFTIQSDGTIQQLTGSFTGCTDSSLPTNAFCREVAVTTSPSPIVSAGATWTTFPPSVPTGLPSGAAVTTLWIRVLKKGEAVSKAVYFTSSFIQ